MQNKNLLFLAVASLNLMACQTLPSAQVGLSEPIVSKEIKTVNGHKVDDKVEREHVTLSARPNSTISFFTVSPANPRRVIVLLPGGPGNVQLKLKDGNLSLSGQNFLLRARAKFFERGYAFVIVDTPSDHASLDNLRSSVDHKTDLTAIHNYLRSRFSAPIWWAGTSRSTESVAILGQQSDIKLDGIILSSSITVSDKRGKSILETSLDKITAPTLVVAHEKDRCHLTPVQRSKEILSKLTGSVRAEYKTIQGGNFPLGNYCEAFSPHGYFGAEDEAVTAMTQFMDHN